MKRLGVYHCFYCDRPLSRQKKTRDHVQPRSKGGSNKPTNVVDSCRTCNTDKASLLLEEFRRVVAFRHNVNPDVFLFPGELKLLKVMKNSEAYERQLKRQKNKRAERKASGLCMRCGKVPARQNRVDCKSCAKRAIGVCSYCSEKNPVIPGTNRCEQCADEYRQDKKKCFDHYGRKCLCCNGELDERFLTLAHVQNDGNQHRAEIGHSSLYKWAIDNAFPVTLQTNCWNCNMGKSVNGGICPHQE